MIRTRINWAEIDFFCSQNISMFLFIAFYYAQNRIKYYSKIKKIGQKQW